MKKNGLPYCKNAGFQIPQDYMENLEDRILAKVTANDRIDSLPGKIENGFLVPEGYFESLEDRIMKNLPERPKEPKVISLLNKESFYYVAGVAAVFVAIVGNSLFHQPEPFTMENLDMLSLENYINETIDYSTPELSTMFSGETFSFAPSSQPDYIDQEAVLEYLHENVEEPSLIFNED